MGHSLGAAVLMQLLNDYDLNQKIDKAIIVDFGYNPNIFSQ